ncbi:MAG: hypothetical protein PQJ47_09280 [Sphaerochaetaceae bacterium]|nr:hypothetical protein [Sphaerochaetaceae bacterium]
MRSIITYLEDKKTKGNIIQIIRENLSLYRMIRTEEKIHSIAGLLYDHLVMECVHSNQYISLSQKTMKEIENVYRNLILNLRHYAMQGSIAEGDLEQIVTKHRKNLIQTLQNNVNNRDQNQICSHCAEYTGSFQFSLLHLEGKMLRPPILDLGCGRRHQLITFLRSRGYDKLYGIDQYKGNDQNILCGNWLEYYFRPSSWGTIIAHMSFSNHFRRSLIAQDPVKGLYERKYHEILDSLSFGGSFIYTPALRIMEKHLDKTRFSITYHPNCDDRNLDTVCIQKES